MKTGLAVYSCRCRCEHLHISDVDAVARVCMLAAGTIAGDRSRVAWLPASLQNRADRQCSYCMVFIEPPSAWQAREEARIRQSSDRMNAPLRLEGIWDYAIIEELQKRGTPTRIMSLVSQLRKRHRHRNKSDKESIKRMILLRIGALIRQKELQRVRRSAKFWYLMTLATIGLSAFESPMTRILGMRLG